MQGSMKEYTVNELGSVLACLNELYDKVRVVEPDTGCVMQKTALPPPAAPATTRAAA